MFRGHVAACAALTAAGLLSGASAIAADVEVNIPVLVPITGFASLEGTAQRNGAVLAIKDAPEGVGVRHEILDTTTAPEVAVTALTKVASDGDVTAVAASMLGTQMLAMLPVALDFKLPLITTSGTAKITEMDNPYVFRFFPSDNVVKVAHARYAVEELGAKRPAIIYQNNAYGQSGHDHLVRNLEKLGVKPVFEEGLDLAVKDMLPVLSKAKDANPDVLLIHLHSGPTALLVKQAAAMNVGVPIVAGSGMHQPSTAALLDPSEMANVCAETASSPVSANTPELAAFLEKYRKEFDTEPDAFAVGQYDGISMVLEAVKNGARTAEEVTKAMAGMTYDGLAMTYKSDGKGNMAHSAIIICYDGKTRVPSVVKSYENVTGVL